MNNSKIPAFPYDISSFNGLDSDQIVDAMRACSGLTKREYFAGLAMQGICCNQLTVNELAEIAKGGSISGMIASLSTVYADALLKELDK